MFRSSENTTRHTAQTSIGGTGRTVRQSARFGSKSVKETARVTIKTAQKSVKTAGQTAKTGVKNSQTTAKAAAKTAHATAKAAQRAAQTARATVKFTIHMAKLTVKAAAALTKGLIALMGSDGAILALFLIIIAVAALFASPFGLLFSDENKEAEVTPVSVVIQDVNEEYNQRIEEIKNDNTWDTLDVRYIGTGGSRGNIWIDILAVFAVKTALTDDGMDVFTIDQTRVDLIRKVFWDMTEINHWMETVSILTATEEHGTSAFCISSSPSEPQGSRRKSTASTTTRTNCWGTFERRIRPVFYGPDHGVRTLGGWNGRYCGGILYLAQRRQ